MAADEEEDLVSEEATDSDEFLRAVARAPEAAPRSELPSSTELTQVAQFRIVEKIGRGGMGIVYRAEDEKLRRTVALKVLPKDFDDDDRRRRRFLREARVAAAIAHPNVATIHEVGEADGRIYIAMELVAGTTLRRRIEQGRLPVAEALRIGKDIARGVAQAHQRGIAHRDLKPDNVMVSEEGVVKVLDFGLAKLTEGTQGGDEPENATVTQEGRIVGTPGYMSPEQATGRATDVRTDVFSLGVILYEMLSATRPFRGETSMDAVIATSRDRHVPISKVVPGVPPALERLIDRCLEKDPAARSASAGEVLAALESLGTESGTSKRALQLGAVALLAAGALAALRFNARPAIREDAPPAKPVATAAPEPTPSVVPAPPPSAAVEARTAPASAASDEPPRIRPQPARSASPRPSASAVPSVISSGPIAPPAPSGGVIEKSPY